MHIPFMRLIEFRPISNRLSVLDTQASYEFRLYSSSQLANILSHVRFLLKLLFPVQRRPGDNEHTKM